jgi:hypothetical protein
MLQDYWNKLCAFMHSNLASVNTLDSLHFGQDNEARLELTRRPWTKEEDQLLVKLVHQYGPKRWSPIAAHLKVLHSSLSLSLTERER